MSLFDMYVVHTNVFAQFDFVQRVQSLYESNLDFSDYDHRIMKKNVQSYNPTLSSIRKYEICKEI